MTNNVSIAKANAAFRNGDYQTAANNYKKLLSQGGIIEKIARSNLRLISAKTRKLIQPSIEEINHKNIKSLVESLKLSDGNLIITYPIIPWEFRTQRPQHLVSRLSKQGFTSLYIANASPPTLPSTDVEILDFLGTRELAAGVYEICLQTEQGFNIYKTEICRRNLAEMTQQLKTVCRYLKPKRLIHLVQFPGWSPLAEKVRQACGGSIVYDCMDHHAGFTNNTSEALSQEEQLIRKADLVLASSLLLERELKPRAKEVLLIKNATEYDNFKHPRPNGKLDHLKGPIIGYFGAISDWFDIELVTECAKKRPNWNFVLIGSTDLCDTSRAEKLSNIHFFGEIPYKDLPGYYSYFDVCIIPFKIIPLTEATNPVKFYEYISAGKPVVATSLPELLPYSDLVFIASNAKMFIDNIEKAYQLRNNDSFTSRLREFAMKNDWDTRVNNLLSHSVFDLHKTETLEAIKIDRKPNEINMEEINQLRHWVHIKDQEIIELRRIRAENEGLINRLKYYVTSRDLNWDKFKSEVLSNRSRYKGVFIQEAVIDWNVPLYQRPQHIATAMGRLGYLVIYRTSGHFDVLNGARKVADNVWITNLPEISYIDNSVHSLYSTSYANDPFDIKYKMAGGRVFYEYIDHIDSDISGAENVQKLLAAKEWAFSGGADYIVASARKLYDEAVAEVGHNKVIYAPNGVDTEHYRSAEHNSTTLPEVYINFRKKYKYIIGYFGAIAPWLWYDMLAELVRIDPEIGYVFIGPDYFNGVDSLPRNGNVLYLGAVEYKILPAYARLFDVCFIPFAPGEIAKTTSPLKLFEYFALEKPVVVTSEMLECIVYDEVIYGHNTETVYQSIRYALTLIGNQDFKDKLRCLADENDWIERAKAMEKVFTGLGSSN